jgi:hypothetical protein
VSFQGLIAVPVALFEIILLPFWLYFRGFKMPEATETELPESVAQLRT